MNTKISFALILFLMLTSVYLIQIKSSIEELETIYLDQYEKGLLKYGEVLLDCPYHKHNWRRMAIEEVIDFIQYVNKRKTKTKLERKINDNEREQDNISKPKPN